ncbi:MAG: hypothetical protein IAE94_15595 [Chthoniobacterales bacterium]|nr:hypothetical protein [Chthoniobacterales bacterium]
MQITEHQIDDFKSDRKDIAPPLPVILRLVPILFYCSIAVAVILSSIFAIQFQLAVQKRDAHKAQSGSLASQTEQARNERAALESQIKKATDIQNWVASSRPMQPLLVEIARSMGPRSSIVDLRLDRDLDNPAQIKMGLRMGTDSTKQLDLTVEKISALNYRAFSPTQTLGRGELDYKATLVRKDPQQQLEEVPQ